MAHGAGCHGYDRSSNHRNVNAWMAPDLHLAHSRQLRSREPGLLHNPMPLPVIPLWTAKSELPQKPSSPAEDGNEDAQSAQLLELRQAHARLRLMLIAGLVVFAVLVAALAYFVHVGARWNAGEQRSSVGPGAASATPNRSGKVP
jgi:hypothetical protein